MIKNTYIFPWIITFLTILLIMTGCRLLPLDPVPDPDTFDLPEVQAEVKIPKEIEDPDYFFTLEIDRVGTLLDDRLSYTQSDLVEVVVYGKDDQLFGKNEYGDQIVFVIQENQCTMNCGGEIGYIVIGDIDTHCIMELRITQIGQMTQCTSECAPGVSIPWYTGVGEQILDPLLRNFKQLASGESRIEQIGNMKWEAKYTLKNFSGLPVIKYCDKSDLP